MSEGLVGGEDFAVDASVIKADASRARGINGDAHIDWSQGDEPTRAVREYLKALEASGPQSDTLSPAKSPAPSKRVSPTDPAARWVAAPGGPPFYAYSTNYLIDLHAGIIMDVEATPAYRSQEVDSTKTMIDRVERRLNLKPHHLVGDTAYGTGPLLNWTVTEKTSNRTCRSGTSPNAMTTRSQAATFSGTKRAMSTAARKDMRFSVTGGSSRHLVAGPPRTTRSSISPVLMTARTAC